MNMLAEEIAAKLAITGLAQQLVDLDLSQPMAFERAVSIGAEIERCAGHAVEARGELEFTPVITTGLITHKGIEAVITRSLAS